MSAKHTRGPWRSFGSSTIYIEARLGDGWIQEVCSVGPTEADKGYGEQQQANARLIAAAPELLEALQWLVDLMPDPELDNDAVQRAQVIKARDAIAKATGGKA